MNLNQIMAVRELNRGLEEMTVLDKIDRQAIREIREHLQSALTTDFESDLNPDLAADEWQGTIDGD